MTEKLEKCRSRNFAIGFVERWIDLAVQDGESMEQVKKISVLFSQKLLDSGNMFLLFTHHIPVVITIIQIMTFVNSDFMVIILFFISCLNFKIQKLAKTQHLISGVVIIREIQEQNMVSTAKTRMSMLMNGTIG